MCIRDRFSIYAVSNIAGITNITDDKFVQVNQNYLTIDGAKLTPELCEKYEKMDGVDYVLPGASWVSFLFPLDDYYQTSGVSALLEGSLADRDMVDVYKRQYYVNAKREDVQECVII